MTRLKHENHTIDWDGSSPVNVGLHCYYFYFAIEMLYQVTFKFGESEIQCWTNL